MDTRALWTYEEETENDKNGFESAGINEACINARTYVTRVENPFRSDEYVVA